jgi:predicted exporter
MLTTQWVFQQVHGITLAFGITLLGVTLDYPVHLFSHLDRNESASLSMLRIWPTLRLGVVTTCLGYLVLVSTDFAGLRQLGIFTLAGLLTAALVSRYLLPRLLPAETPARPRGIRLLHPLNREGWAPAILMSLLSLLAVVTLSTSQHLWNDDVAVLSPLPPHLLQQDNILRQQIMASESNQLLLLRGDTLQHLLEQCEALTPVLKRAVEEGFTAGIKLPCDTLPSQRMQKARQALIPDRAEMAARLEGALEGLPFRPGAFNAFLDDLQQSRELPTMSYTNLAESPLRARLDSQLKQRQGRWLALLPLRQVTHEEALAGLLRDEMPEVTYFNLRRETSRLIGSFRQEILHKVAAGALVMLATLWIGLRSIAHAIGTLVPIAVALLCTLGILVMQGVSMNIFHLISLMLVLGIGIDFSLFFSRRPACEAERYHTLHALTLCALSTTSVFAILGSSDIPVLHAIGQTVAFGVGLSYLATYAFWHIPALPLRGDTS